MNDLCGVKNLKSVEFTMKNGYTNILNQRNYYVYQITPYSLGQR